MRIIDKRRRKPYVLRKPMVLLLVLMGGQILIAAIFAILNGVMDWRLALVLLLGWTGAIAAPPLLWILLFPEISDPYDPLIRTPWDKR